MRFHLTTILVFLLLASCAKSPIHQFIDEVKENRSAVAVTIPGWLIRGGTNLALKGIEDEDERAIMGIGKKIKEIRFVADQKYTLPANRLNSLISAMTIEDHYETYTTVRQKDAMVYVMVQEDKMKISNLAVLVHGDKSLVVMNMKTDLTFDELKSADFTWNKQKENTLH